MLQRQSKTKKLYYYYYHYDIISSRQYMLLGVLTTEKSYTYEGYTILQLFFVCKSKTHHFWI